MDNLEDARKTFEKCISLNDTTVRSRAQKKLLELESLPKRIDTSLTY